MKPVVKKRQSGKKTRDTSRKPNEMTISRASRGDYRSVLSWRQRGLTTQAKEGLMQEYHEWSEQPNSIDFLDFLHDHGIPYNTFCDWFNKHADLKELHATVKTKIGARRQRIAFFPKTHEADSQALQKTLRLYHPDWRESYDEDAKNKEKEAAGNVTVVLDRVEETDVPELDG